MRSKEEIEQALEQMRDEMFGDGYPRKGNTYAFGRLSGINVALNWMLGGDNGKVSKLISPETWKQRQASISESIDRENRAVDEYALDHPEEVAMIRADVIRRLTQDLHESGNP